jgi:glutamate racemase
MKTHTIGFIDSGVGGFTILQRIGQRIPEARLIYCADRGFFPYGDKAEDILIPRLILLTEALLEKAPLDLLILACNTASTIGLDKLRERFPIPIIGVVPGVKPAALLSQTKHIGVLATPLTAKSHYLGQLIEKFAKDCQVTVVGSQSLVWEAEKKILGGSFECPFDELKPLIENPSIDGIVLACTHFPLLIEDLNGVFPRPVFWVEPSEAIAQRARELLGKIPGRQGLLQDHRYFDTKNLTHLSSYSRFFPAPPTGEMLGV